MFSGCPSTSPYHRNAMNSPSTAREPSGLQAHRCVPPGPCSAAVRRPDDTRAGSDEEPSWRCFEPVQSCSGQGRYRVLDLIQSYPGRPGLCRCVALPARDLPQEQHCCPARSGAERCAPVVRAVAEPDVPARCCCSWAPHSPGGHHSGRQLAAVVERDEFPLPAVRLFCLARDGQLPARHCVALGSDCRAFLPGVEQGGP